MATIVFDLNQNIWILINKIKPRILLKSQAGGYESLSFNHRIAALFNRLKIDTIVSTTYRRIKIF